MAIKKITYETIDNIDYQSKISRFLFGKNDPPIITKVAFYLGIAGWFYFFIWYLAAFMSIKFIDGIEHPEQIKANFNKIGLEYGFDNFQTTLENVLMITLICLGAVLISLFMIYRRKIYGYYIYLGGWLASILVMVFMLGFKFFWEEITHMDKAIMLILILPYFVFYYLLKKTKESE
ncbi:MAG: hypothetical protein KDC84_09715 [Crocinitomicaceae bacterium]|nr:hypothetical protein [Crocinitomicaceae bacterium]